jgi:glutamine cyclotransferase
MDRPERRDQSTMSNPDGVLNGIAYDAKDKRLFVTGKLWPKLYEIKVKP